MELIALLGVGLIAWFVWHSSHLVGVNGSSPNQDTDITRWLRVSYGYGKPPGHLFGIRLDHAVMTKDKRIWCTLTFTQSPEYFRGMTAEMKADLDRELGLDLVAWLRYDGILRVRILEEGWPLTLSYRVSDGSEYLTETIQPRV
jgi:hypothetical protein